MNLTPPQPPTVPAPALRPTPPTPPRIDKAPFVKNQSDDTPQVTRKVETPEDMARDAVANGAGALTKRTVDKGDKETQPVAPTPRQNIPVAESADTQSDYDRGQDVLREFRELDAREAQGSYNQNLPAQTSTEQSHTVTPKLNYQEGHGGVFWIFTIIFVVVATFVIVKKFLLTDKPALTKSQLFDDPTDKKQLETRKAIRNEELEIKKPVSAPPKKNEDKGKPFEVRV